MTDITPGAHFDPQLMNPIERPFPWPFHWLWDRQRSGSFPQQMLIAKPFGTSVAGQAHTAINMSPGAHFDPRLMNPIERPFPWPWERHAQSRGGEMMEPTP